MKTALLAGLAALTVVSPCFAAPPASRGDLMKTCMAEWKLKSKSPEKLKYTAFLSECLKRQNAQAHAPR